MSTVFVSHSSHDDLLTELLTKWMISNGFTDIFADHVKLKTGDRWAEALRNAQSTCRIILCIVTPSWLSSDECFGEFLAGWYAGKRIMPLFSVRHADLDERQKDRLSRVLAEDQGFDLTDIGAPEKLDFEANPRLTEALAGGLRAGGALSKVGLDPHAFEVNIKKLPEPFPGLESFGDDDADAAIFFGRSPEIAGCLEDLRSMRASGDRRIYAIMGASGSGKSSLMKAGILPRLRREPAWLVLRSFRPGSDPLYSLADAIVRTAADMNIHWASGSIHEEMRAAWRDARAKIGRLPALSLEARTENYEQALSFDQALVMVFERRLEVLRQHARRSLSTCILTIDQAEEIVRGEDESSIALSDYLAALASFPPNEEGPIPYSIVLTVRDDSFSELRSSDKFRRVRFRTADIRTLPVYRFAEAIELPAERYGVVMEPALVQSLVEDAPASDSLPLLAFALRRLWSRFSREHKISRENYEAFGKLSGIIEDAAERALRGMVPRDELPLTPLRVPAEREKRVASLFVPALAQVNEYGHALKRLAPAGAFSEADRELLAPFIRWRLVVTRGSQIEVAHEAMFREWPRFAEWLKPEKERLESLRGVEAAASTWQAQHRQPEYLTHRGKRLSAAEALFNVQDYKRQIESNSSIRDYIFSCRRNERRRSFGIFAAASIFTLFGVTLIATNAQTVAVLVGTIENFRAALPGSQLIGGDILDELDIRRNLLRADIQSSLKEKIELERRSRGDDSWAIGQFAAALGRGAVDLRKLEDYFKSTLSSECACWSPLDGGQHAAATAYVMLGQLKQGIQIPGLAIEKILERQSESGAWPLYFNAIRDDVTNSTYATAMLILALHEYVSAEKIDIGTSGRVINAIARGRAWLEKVAPSRGKLWSDYPNSDQRTVYSRGNSAFILFALLKTGATAKDQQLFIDWFDNLGAPKAFDELDNSDQFVTLASGDTRRDGTRYVGLPWELAAIGAGETILKPYQRIRARRFFKDALLTWQRDDIGKLDFVRADTLYALNTLFQESK